MASAGANNVDGQAAAPDEAAMLDWEEGDRFSFEDSDRFEEDSLCSWSSEPESLCNNWRGWKRPAYANGNYTIGNKKLAEGESIVETCFIVRVRLLTYGSLATTARLTRTRSDNDQLV